ncbi:MAG: MFS transporter [Thermofilaceae archaeon]|nr:MFS transporter [Thermofilaceae archaeon]MDW8004024.1 MFS transporter [Thermofilaceae archaeon]
MSNRYNSLVRSITALYASYFFSFFHRTVTGVLLPEMEVLAERGGWDPRLFTALASSAYFYTYAAMQLPAGVLADALGARLYATLSIGLMASGSLLSTIGNPSLFILGRLLVGLGAAAIWISMQRIIGLKARKDRGGLLTGLGLMVGGIGSLFATIPAKNFVEVFGIQALFLFLGLASLLCAFGVFLLVDDKGIGLGSTKQGLVAAVKQLRLVARTPHSLALVVAGLGTYSAYLAYQSYWGSLYLTACYRVSPSYTAYLLFLTSLTFTVSVPAVGFFSDNIGRRKPLLTLTCFLHTVFWLFSIILAWGGSSELLALHAVLLGLVAATHSIISPMAREAYDPEFSGTNLSFVNASTFIGVAIYQVTGYYVQNPLSALALFTLTGALSIILTPWVKETMVEDEENS